MSNRTFHTIRLQDGTLCNLDKRITREAVSLATLFRSIPDPRRAQGRRHSLGMILVMVFVAMLQGSQDLKDARLFALANKRFFRKAVDMEMPHGVPDTTTISRIFRVLDPNELVRVFREFLAILSLSLGDVLSFDGKTIRAVTGGDAVRHMLSLFSHETHLAVGQIGVDSKENEIPALERLLSQGATMVRGKLLLGDALHTQRATARMILNSGADYLFTVKGNQRKLRRVIQTELEARKSQADTYTSSTVNRRRSMTVTVAALAVSEEGLALATGQHWAGVRVVGTLHRLGTRVSKDGTTTPVDETVGLISSRMLSAKEVAKYLRAHWCIENNLHWVKDVVLGEDRHTLRRGNAPQIMSFLRSMCISLCNALKLRSISDTIHNLEKSTALLGRFLRMAAVT
jgi:predicted transposase YbfD/YdcC